MMSRQPNKMNIRVLFSILSLFIFAGQPWQAQAVTTATNRFHFTKTGVLLGLPYLSSHPISQRNETIDRVLVSVHSSGYDAYQYLTNGLASAAMVPGASDRTLVIAPHFLLNSTNYIVDPIDSDMLYWNVEPFWGSHQALRGPNRQSVLISAYEVLDIMLNFVVTNSFFPNLKTVVIAGHSAGGQLVNRYAAGNRFQNNSLAPDLHVRYVVMAPSSYVYFDTQRVVPGTLDVFQTPNTNAAAFNTYGYGLDSLYAYLSTTGANGMRTNYYNRFVFYMVGALDNFQDGSMSTTYASMLQGSNRLERAQVYFNYLQHYFGPAILETQQFEVVPKVGHYGRGLMTSKAGLKYLFDQDTSDIDDDGISDWQEWLFGATATDGNPVLNIGGTPLCLSWSAVRGRRYDIMASRDLQSEFGTVFSTNGFSGTAVYPAMHPNSTSAFYKLSTHVH